MEIWRLKDNGATIDLLGSRDVINHVTIRLAMATSYRWSIVTMRLSGTVMEIGASPSDGCIEYTKTN